MNHPTALSHRRISLGTVLLCTGILIAATPTTSNAQPDTTAESPRLVVITFANISGDETDDWLGIGFAEGLATSFHTGLTASSVAAAERLGASQIIEGTHERIGNRLRATALLIDLTTQRVISSAVVDGEANDLFQLQDSLAAQLGSPPAEGALPPASSAAAAAEPSRRRGSRDVPRTTETQAGMTNSGFASRTIIDGPPPPVVPAMVARNDRGQATIRATRLNAPLTLDGALDEPIYAAVASIDGFIQQEPSEGSPATEQTEAWIFFDDDTLYVSARCWDSQPERMVANEMRRDNLAIFQNENFAVVLDTFYDRRNGFMFHTNPLGGKFDGYITAGNMNRDWNGVWDVRTNRSEDGWTVEIAIPFKTVRFSPGTAQTWGINLRRIVRWKNEVSYLTAVPAAYGLAGIMRLSVAGAVVGVQAPSASGNIEVKPYVISGLTTDLLAATPTSNALDRDAGFDVKYGVTQGLTADFTYNTDFAQVEVDEQQVNLTRFNLFFPEKREFFLEGQGIFDFGGGRGFSGRGFGRRMGGSSGGASNTPILFFSRRIGLSEGLPVPIEVGGRLTGKVGAFSIGLLNIKTGAGGVSSIRPTNFGVVRIKRDILRRSSIGLLTTHRSVAIAGNGSNQLYGVDANFAFYDNLNINNYLARTKTGGLEGDDLSYRSQFDYSGDRYGLQVERLVVNEDFNPEIGFVRRTNFQRSFGSARFSPRPANLTSVRKLSWETSFDYVTNGAGRVETRIATGVFGIEFENSDQLFVETSHNYEYLSDPFDIASDVSLAIGGYSFTDTRASFAFGNQRRVSGNVSASHGSFFGGTKTSVGASRGRIGLSPQLSIEPSLEINWVDVPAGTFTTALVTSRATFAVNPRAFVSALLQYNSSAESLSTNVRLRWEYQPGSELFVVYTDLRDTLSPHFAQLENRAFIVKINRLFQF